MANILIIDDNKMLCDMLCRKFNRMNHMSEYALNIEGGLKKVLSQDFDIVYLDVNLPDGNGLDILPSIKRAPSSPEVIIFTAEGDPDGAELAITSGAWDYIEKPPSIKELVLPLTRALQYRSEKNKKTSRPILKRGDILGSSSKLQECLDLLSEAASSDENVLLTGETGTGKELFARAIHENSSRSGKNFVVLDCTALPDTLVESILFGHEKGAFTGADSARTGMIKQADGGSLFLDEVGELTLSLQKTFLRVLQERSFRPLSGAHEIKSDFRLIAATNRDLDEMSKTGDFRKDLLYRLKSLLIHLPSLNERHGDIKEITVNHVSRLSEESGFAMKGFSSEFFAALAHYDWPGNVRELLTTIERALVASRGEPTLFPRHLPTHIRVQIAQSNLNKSNGAKVNAVKGLAISEALPPLKEYREAFLLELEAQYLQKLMLHSKGNIQEACRISGLSQSRLYFLLKKYNIKGVGKN